MNDSGNDLERNRGEGPTTPSRDRSRNWAYLLVAAGVLLLAGNLGWLQGVGDWLWALLFLAGGIGFLYYHSTSRQWWALLPGFALLAIGLAILAGDAGGPLFLGVLAAGFAAVYLTGRRRWWAVIPAGVLATLAVVAWLEEGFAGWDAGWVFFLGLALTFGVLYLLPASQGKQRWAIFPALALFGMTLAIIVSSKVAGVIVPLLMVLTGGYLLWRQRGSGGGPRQPTKEV